MKKINKKTLVLTSVITLLPILAGVLLWDKLPDTIATHFGMDGTPNGWSSKNFTVFGLPIMFCFFHLLSLIVTSADPKYENMSDKLYKIVVWIIPAVSWILAAVTYTYALGIEINTAKYGMAGTGILFMFIGNYLPKCKQNYTMGIKIPWTLEDEDNWNKTHRLAGFLWVAGGLLIAVNAFFGSVWLFLVITMVMTIIPVIYSYLYYKKKQKK